MDKASLTKIGECQLHTVSGKPCGKGVALTLFDGEDSGLKMEWTAHEARNMAAQLVRFADATGE